MIHSSIKYKNDDPGIFLLSNFDSLIGEEVVISSDLIQKNFDEVENKIKNFKYKDINKEIDESVAEAESIINNLFNNDTFSITDANISEHNEDLQAVNIRENDVYKNELFKKKDIEVNDNQVEKSLVISEDIKNISEGINDEILTTKYNAELTNINKINTIDQHSMSSDTELFDEYTSFDYVFDNFDALSSVDDWENDEVSSEAKYNDLIWPEENDIFTDDEQKEVNIIKKINSYTSKTPISENNNNLNVNMKLPTVEFDRNNSKEVNLNKQTSSSSTNFRKWLSENKNSAKIQSYFKILKNENIRNTSNIINTSALRYIFRGKVFRKNYISNSSFNSNLVSSLSNIITNKETNTINTIKGENSIHSQCQSSINNNIESKRSLKQRALPLKISTKYQINNRTRRIRENDVGTIWLVREIYLSLASQILKLSMSIDGEWLILGSQDGYIRQWKFREEDLHNNNSNCEPFFNEKEDFLIEAHSNAIISLQWENDENSHRFLSSSMDRTVKLWEAGNYEPCAVINCSDWPTSVSFHPIQKNILFIGSLDASVQLLRLTPKTISSFNDISIDSEKLEVNSRSNKYMNSISSRNHLKYQTKVIETIRVQDLLTTLSISPNGKYLACGFKDGGVAFYDARTLKYRCDVDCRNRRGKTSKGKKVSGICWRKDNRSVLVTTNDSRVRLFNLSDLSTFVKFKGHINKETLLSAQISNDEKLIVCGSENGYICIWDIQYEYGRSLVNTSYYRHSNYDSLSQSVNINNSQMATCLDRSNIRRGPTQHCVDSFKAFDSSITSTILAPATFAKKIIKYFRKNNKNMQKYPTISSNITEKNLNVFIATNRNGQIRILVNIPN